MKKIILLFYLFAFMPVMALCKGLDRNSPGFEIASFLCQPEMSQWPTARWSALSYDKTGVRTYWKKYLIVYNDTLYYYEISCTDDVGLYDVLCNKYYSIREHVQCKFDQKYVSAFKVMFNETIKGNDMPDHYQRDDEDVTLSDLCTPGFAFSVREMGKFGTLLNKIVIALKNKASSDNINQMLGDYFLQ